MNILQVMCKIISVCFIGNLWSVTDKDSDIITTDIINRLDDVAKNGEMRHMIKVVSEARK